MLKPNVISWDFRLFYRKINLKILYYTIELLSRLSVLCVHLIYTMFDTKYHSNKLKLNTVDNNIICYNLCKTYKRTMKTRLCGASLSVTILSLHCCDFTIFINK